MVIWPVAALVGSLPELHSVASLSPTGWLIMLYLIAFMSTTSQWLYFRCLSEVKASQASTFIYLTPFFTVILAAIFLGEIPTPAALVAGVLILIGVWVVNRPQHKRAPELIVSPQVPRPDPGVLAEKEPAKNPISSGGHDQT
jgi:drug/metabolite transporter (DMT)-like permease